MMTVAELKKLLLDEDDSLEVQLYFHDGLCDRSIPKGFWYRLPVDSVIVDRYDGRLNIVAEA